MSTEHSMTLSDDRHAAVLAALHKHEMAWAVYEFHFQRNCNSDPCHKEQRAMTRIYATWEALKTLGAVNDMGEINYPLNQAELAALKKTRCNELERLHGGATLTT